MMAARIVSLASAGTWRAPTGLVRSTARAEHRAGRPALRIDVGWYHATTLGRLAQTLDGHHWSGAVNRLQNADLNRRDQFRPRTLTACLTPGLG